MHVKRLHVERGVYRLLYETGGGASEDHLHGLRQRWLVSFIG